MVMRKIEMRRYAEGLDLQQLYGKMSRFNCVHDFYDHFTCNQQNYIKPVNLVDCSKIRLYWADIRCFILTCIKT